MEKVLYKRNAQGKPLFWSIDKYDDYLLINYGLIEGKIHTERIPITLKNANELESRVKAKRKEGYKELSELKDGISEEMLGIKARDKNYNKTQLINFLNTYLPKYSTTQEGFIFPMLAKVLEDNKPFEKYSTFLGQWKINGLRCIIGAENNQMDLFKPIKLIYHSRTGENWTSKMNWMDEILLPNITKELLDMMIEEGVCLDGELYLPGYSVNDINSFVKNTSLNQHYQLQYWCYDICCENMSADKRNKVREDNIYLGYWDNCSKYRHLNNKEQFILLPTVLISDITVATQYRNEFIDCGFEGLILRNPNAEYQFGKRNQAMFKFKKVDDGLFDIVDIKEDKRGLPIYTLRNDINEELFDCTINLTQAKQRLQLQMAKELIGKKAFVEYRERSGKTQVPFHAKIIKIYI